MEIQSTIRLERVTKRFSLGTEGGFTAVEDVSLEVHPGEFVSVVGPSGCGKSTLLGMISGLLPLSSGRSQASRWLWSLSWPGGRRPGRRSGRRWISASVQPRGGRSTPRWIWPRPWGTSRRKGWSGGHRAATRHDSEGGERLGQTHQWMAVNPVEKWAEVMPAELVGDRATWIESFKASKETLTTDSLPTREAVMTVLRTFETVGQIPNATRMDPEGLIDTHFVRKALEGK